MKVNIKNPKIGIQFKTERIDKGLGENLSTELTEQDNLLTEQEITIEDIITALEGKSASGGGITPSVEGNTLILAGANIEGGVLSI